MQASPAPRTQEDQQDDDTQQISWNVPEADALQHIDEPDVVMRVAIVDIKRCKQQATLNLRCNILSNRYRGQRRLSSVWHSN